MNQKIADMLEIFTDTDKTVVMAVLLVLAAFFRVEGHIDGPGFVDLVRTTTIAYFGTTTATHFVEMIKDHLSNKLEEIKNKNLPVASIKEEG